MKRLDLTAACLLLTLSACIRREALNAEADILNCYLPEEILTGKEIDYTLPFSEARGGYPIFIEVKAGTDLTALAPEFQLTPGATILPTGKSVHDFTRPVYYTVTSEDGKWQRRYVLSIHYPDTTKIPTSFHFEDTERQGNYDVFYEASEGAQLTWASGNQGYALTGNGKAPADFPTSQSDDGYIGKCVKLTTQLTGSLGEKVGKPIAAGNLFIGKFELLNALGDALSATQFGTTFRHLPTRLTGYYRYKAGERFYDNGTYSDRKDRFSIYAVFFEKADSLSYLDGHMAEEGFRSPLMRAIALMPDEEKLETGEWRRFEIPFDYERYGREIDPDKLADGRYAISIVLASSEDGDRFMGAPGSTLYVDEVQIEYN